MVATSRHQAERKFVKGKNDGGKSNKGDEKRNPDIEE